MAVESYIAFGDGSERDEGAFYGLVMIPSDKVDAYIQRFREIKVRYGGQPEYKIHCRELFSDHQRQKGPWKHLDYAGAERMCVEILRTLKEYEPQLLIGHWPKAQYPKRFRLRGKDGHPDVVHQIDDKWVTLLCFQYIASHLCPVVRCIPLDLHDFPAPPGAPRWRLIARRQGAGYPLSRIYLDREQTRIRWISKTVQWMSVAREIVVISETGESFLPLDNSPQPHELVDIADLFLFSFSRHVYGVRPLALDGLNLLVHPEIIPFQGEELAMGLPPV